LRRYRGKYTQLSEEMTNVRALNTELLARNAELVGGSAVDRKAIQALQDDLQEGREHCDAQSNWIANLTGAREAQARRILELEDERGDLADAVRSLEDRLKSERLARERSELALERTQAEIAELVEQATQHGRTIKLLRDRLQHVGRTLDDTLATRADEGDLRQQILTLKARLYDLTST